LSPEGYAYEKDILFTADSTGISETIIMEDKKTEVSIEKIDEETGEILTGGCFSIREKDTGNLIKSFASEGKPYVLKGILIAGKTYQLIEEEPPAGYSYSQGKEFTVPKEAENLIVTMKDKKTTVYIKKTAFQLTTGTPSEAEILLPGNVLQILNEDKSPAKAIKDSSGFKTGEDLIFSTTKDIKEIKGQLMPGTPYFLHEVTPAKGYSYGEDVSFKVSLDGSPDEVVMTNYETHVVLSKKSITDNQELPGNLMSVRDKNGTIVEKWISTEAPHHIVGKLAAGESYYFCEEKPQKGYAYAEPVLFTVERNNKVTMAEMTNDTTKVNIHKVDSKGRLLEGAVLRILNQKGEIVVPDFTSGLEEHKIEGILEAGETYLLKEIKPPDGYQFSETIEFNVPKEAKVINVYMTDLKNPGTDGRPPVPVVPPSQPQTIPPDETVKVGKITASYHKSPLNPSWLEMIYGKTGKMRGEKTGDDFSLAIWTIGMLISLTGAVITIKKGRHKRRKK
jgi:uncharacterized surface anchored protein